jgi:hypothetical protein
MQHSQEAWIPDAGKSASGQTVYSTGVHILRELPVKLLQERPIVHGGNFHFICQNTPLFYTILRAMGNPEMDVLPQSIPRRS